MKTQKSKILLLSVLLLLVALSAATAQTLSPDTDELLWRSTSFRNTTNNETVEHGSEFSSSPDEITLTQAGSDQQYTFSVASKEGSWTDVNLEGSVLFNITWHSFDGTVLFRKVNGQTQVIVTILKDNSNIMPFEFMVSEVTRK